MILHNMTNMVNLWHFKFNQNLESYLMELSMLILQGPCLLMKAKGSTTNWICIANSYWMVITLTKCQFA